MIASILMRGRMKIATWNVNGIRARQAQVQELLDREQPDVLCLQEIKASLDQLPVWLCDLEGYWCYWHGGKGYSGVALHVRKASVPERPAFDHPEFDYENRIVVARLRATVTDTTPRRRNPHITVASIYVPNGGKDFPAKMRFLESLDAFSANCSAAGQPFVLCGDLNVALTDMDVHPKERRPNVTGQRPDERELMQRILSHGLVDVHRSVRTGQRRSLHLVGAVAEHAAAEHRLEAGLRLRQRAGRSTRDVLRGAARNRHERSRPGHSRLRRLNSQPLTLNVIDGRLWRGTSSGSAPTCPPIFDGAEPSDWTRLEKANTPLRLT